MKVPFTDVGISEGNLRQEILDGLAQVIERRGFILGQEVEAFEKEFAAFCGRKHCIAVNSGTSAIHLALLGLGIGGPGDEVITVPNTFIATLEAIAYTGASIHLVDVDEETYTMNCAALAGALTPKTKAVVPVHLYGQTADLGVLCELAHAKGVAVIEDACQAHGAQYGGRPAGSFGAAGCFSFYPSKNLGACGEGGAVVTDDDCVAETVRILRDHGQRQKGVHERIGFNYRMEGFQGLVLRKKLRYLEDWNRRRREAACWYGELLQDVPVTLPRVGMDRDHVYHLYVIRCPKRDLLQHYLMDRDIGVGIHYPMPCHLQPCFRSLGYGPGDFPVSERLSREILSLPMFPGITREQVACVCGHIREFYRSN